MLHGGIWLALLELIWALLIGVCLALYGSSCSSLVRTQHNHGMADEASVEKV